MPPTDVAAAANARLVPIVEYTTDRRGLGMFQRLSAVLQRGISGAGQIPVTRRNPEFHGYAANPQPQLTGAASLLGGARPITESNPQLSDERSAQLDDPALSIFRQRMMRRQG